MPIPVAAKDWEGAMMEIKVPQGMDMVHFISPYLTSFQAFRRNGSALRIPLDTALLP